MYTSRTPHVHPMHTSDAYTPCTPHLNIAVDGTAADRMSEANNDIFQRFARRDDLVDCLKLHSTKQGRRIIESPNSGGNRVILVCKTHGAQSETNNTPHECGYKVVLKKSRSKKVQLKWSMDRQKSNLQHSAHCISEGKITYRETKILTRDKSGAKIEEIKERIATTNKISMASVPHSVAMQYRLACVYNTQNYDGNWAKLDRWGKEFEARNSGSKFHLEADEEGRFKRLFVGIGSAVRIADKTGIEFSGIDATFFRHVIYKGRALILVTRDGNNQILVLAWVIAQKENADNYEYMAEQVKEMDGLKEYLNRPQQLMYSDRHKGIPAFEKQFKCGTANCIVHVADNVKDWVKKKAGPQVSSMSLM